MVMKIIEPVPVLFPEPELVLNVAPHPYAALLWMEFLAGAPEAMAIMGYNGSSLNQGALKYELFKGKKLCGLDWDNFGKDKKWR